MASQVRGKGNINVSTEKLRFKMSQSAIGHGNG